MQVASPIPKRVMTTCGVDFFVRTLYLFPFKNCSFHCSYGCILLSVYSMTTLSGFSYAWHIKKILVKPQLRRCWINYALNRNVNLDFGSELIWLQLLPVSNKALCWRCVTVVSLIRVLQHIVSAKRIFQQWEGFKGKSCVHLLYFDVIHRVCSTGHSIDEHSWWFTVRTCVGSP